LSQYSLKMKGVSKKYMMIKKKLKYMNLYAKYNRKEMRKGLC